MTFAKRFNISAALESIKEDKTGLKPATEGDTVDQLEASTPVPLDDTPPVDEAVVVADVAPVDEAAPVDTPAVVDAGLVDASAAPAVVAPEVPVDEAVAVPEPVILDTIPANPGAEGACGGDGVDGAVVDAAAPDAVVDTPPTEGAVDAVDPLAAPAEAPVADVPADTPPVDTAPVDAVVDTPSDTTGEAEEVMSEDEEIELYDEEIATGLEAIDQLGKLSTAIETMQTNKVGIESYSEFSKITVEAICSKIGLKPGSKAYPSLENITVESLKAFSTKISTSVEGFKEKVTELKAAKEAKKS